MIDCSLVVWGVHNLMIHTIVRAVCPLAAESLVHAVLEWWKHLLVVSSDVRMVGQLVFDEWLLCWWTCTCIWDMRILRISWIIPQALGLHFVFYQLGIRRNVVNYLLPRLTETSIDLQFLICYSWCIRFLQTFTWVHLIILILTWVICTVTLESWVTTCTVLTCTNSGLDSGWITIYWILTTTCRSSMRPSECLTTELTCMTIFCIHSYFLISFLIF